MAFTKLQKGVFAPSSRRSATGVRIGVRGNNGKQIYIAVPANLFAQIGASKRDRVDILVGTGADEGTLALVRSEDGYTIFHNNAQNTDLRVAINPKRAGIIADKFPIAECKHQIVESPYGRALIVILPTRIRDTASLKIGTAAAANGGIHANA